MSFAAEMMGDGPVPGTWPMADMPVRTAASYGCVYVHLGAATLGEPCSVGCERKARFAVLFNVAEKHKLERWCTPCAIAVGNVCGAA